MGVLDFKLSVEGLQQAAIIFVRFVLIIFFSTLLTLTTTPLAWLMVLSRGLHL